MIFKDNKVFFCDNCDCGQHELYEDENGNIILRWGKDADENFIEIKLTKSQLKLIITGGTELLNKPNGKR